MPYSTPPFVQIPTVLINWCKIIQIHQISCHNSIAKLIKGHNLKYHFMTEEEVNLQIFLTFAVDEGGLPVS